MGADRSSHPGAPGPDDDPASVSGRMPETTIANPIDDVARAAVAAAVNDIAQALEAEQDEPPPPGEIAQAGGDEAAWREHHRAVAGRLRRMATAVAGPRLEFMVAAELRDVLDLHDDHTLKAAAAALDAAIAQAVPERRALMGAAGARRRQERGFDITFVGGRGEPLALPPFAYTTGLADQPHPELVIVALAPAPAAALLGGLATEIVKGALTIAPGEEIEGQLEGGYVLRAIAATDALLAQLPAAALTAGALQILLPDRAGRFAGDPGADDAFAQSQVFPDDPAGP